MIFHSMEIPQNEQVYQQLFSFYYFNANGLSSKEPEKVNSLTPFTNIHLKFICLMIHENGTNLLSMKICHLQ